MISGFEFRDLVLNRFFQDPTADPSLMTTIMEFHDVNWLNQKDKEFFANDLIMVAKCRFLDEAMLDNNFAGQNYTSDAIATYAAHMNFLAQAMKRIEEVAVMMVNN